MKQIVTMIACALALVSCGNANSSSEKENDNTPKEELVGGFTAFRDVTPEELELFKEATGTGDIILTPESVATQVVAGINYLFNCTSKNNITGAEGRCKVKIYKNLQGELTVTEITKE